MPIDDELLKPSRELIAHIDAQIGEMEADTVAKIDRYGDVDKDYANDIWHQHQMAIEPLRRQRDHVVMMIAAYYGMQAVPSIIMLSEKPE
jgi:hypothetical protein